MPRATTCVLDRTEISIADALRLRDDARSTATSVPDFCCIFCSESVRPHKDGSYGAAHFEHLRRNPLCKLSDLERA